MEPITPDDLLRLPPDERAALIFLAGMGDQFVSTLDLLAAQLPDCGSDRLRRVVRGLEARGLVARRKLSHVGTEFRILAKLPDVAMQGDRFVIPQVKQRWVQVPRRPAIPEVSTVPLDALPLIGNAPARKPVVLRFHRGESESDFTWTITDTKTSEPAKDCVVRASLLYGRSQFGIGGVPIVGFHNRLLQHCGEGQYVCRIRLSAQVVVGTNYVCVIDAVRAGRPFGFWEEPSEVTDPIC